MTIALALRVNDGVVLATDSHGTITMGDAQGGVVHSVYNHMDKLFNVRRGLPVAAAFHGLASIGPESIATLMKDLRKRLSTQGDPWCLDVDAYTVEEVAKRIADFFGNQKYTPFLQSITPPIPKVNWTLLGFLVAGYSAKSHEAEVFRVLISGEGVSVHRQQSTIVWGGDPELMSRLVLGVDFRVRNLLVAELKPTNKAEEDAITKALQAAQDVVEAAILPAPMPIKDVTELAHFLVDASSKYSRYTPGPQTIGGAIDVAAITKHEGFKWVHRKYYYDRQINPDA